MIHTFTVGCINIIEKVKNSLGNIQFETFWYVRPPCLDLRTHITPHMLYMELLCDETYLDSVCPHLCLYSSCLLIWICPQRERERLKESTIWLLNKLRANWTIGARCKRDAGWFDCPSTWKDLNHRWNIHLNGDELPPFSSTAAGHTLTKSARVCTEAKSGGSNMRELCDEEQQVHPI